MRWTIDGNPSSGKAAILVLISRIVGRMIGVLSRTQTRLLTKAQYHGWMPSDAESEKLLRRQTLLFNWRMARKALKKLGKVENKA